MPIDERMIDAAAAAFAEEHKRWARLPHHGGGRGYRAERRADLEQRSFVNGVTPPEPQDKLETFETERQRDEHIFRECIKSALEAAAPKDAAA